MLEYVLSKVSYRELGYDRTTIFRARKRQIRVSDNMLKAILKHLSEEEFTRIAGSRVKLESLGVVRRGAVDYSLVIEILELAKKDKFLKNLIAKWFVENVQYEIPHIVKVKEEHVRKFEKFLKAKRARKTVRERLLKVLGIASLVLAILGYTSQNGKILLELAMILAFTTMVSIHNV